MSDNHDLLNDKDVYSFEEHEAENVCSNKDAVALRNSSAFGTKIGSLIGRVKKLLFFYTPILLSFCVAIPTGYVLTHLTESMPARLCL